MIWASELGPGEAGGLWAAAEFCSTIPHRASGHNALFSVMDDAALFLRVENQADANYCGRRCPSSENDGVTARRFGRAFRQTFSPFEFSGCPICRQRPFNSGGNCVVGGRRKALARTGCGEFKKRCAS